MLGGGAALLALCVVADAATGPAMLPPATVARSVFGLGADPMVDAIVWSIRLPVALMAVLVGAALGLTGAVMQTILNNPPGVELPRLASRRARDFGAALVIVIGAALPIPEAQAHPDIGFRFRGAGVFLRVAARRAARGDAGDAGAGRHRADVPCSRRHWQRCSSWPRPRRCSRSCSGCSAACSGRPGPKLAIVAAVLVVAVPLLMRDAWALTALRFGE
jgi:iron complex transport system permease protein